MKKTIALLLALVLLVSPMLSACGGSAEEKGISLVVILGFHANACRPSREMLENSGLALLVEQAIDYYKDSVGDIHAEANVKFILCDGEPEVIELKLDGEPINMHFMSGNKPSLQEDLSYLSEDIITALMDPDLMADDEEVDLLAALSMAGDLLRSDPGRQNHIMVIDAGLNTAGFLKMQDPAVCERIQAIGKAGAAEGAADDAAKKAAAALVEELPSGSIADLKDIYVTYHGLGNVDNITQKTITDQLVKDSLLNFWTAFFKESGATLVMDLVFTVNENGTPMVHNSDSESDEDVGYPFVSSVPFVSEELQWMPSGGSNNGTGVQEPEAPLSFNANTLAFESQSHEFRNYAKAVAEIKSRQDYFDRILEQDPNAIFYVVGSIAKTSPERTREEGSLSGERANEVAKIMVKECGIPADQIRIIPAGLTVLSWRCAEEFPGGVRTDETPANMQRNRVVAIVPSIFTNAMNELKGANGSGVNLLELAVPYVG